MDIENNDVAQEEIQEQPESSPEQEQQTESNKPEEKQESSLPFHEHPRFKELISEKNEYREQSKAFERQLSELSKKLENFQQTSTPKQEDALMARLKGIDPEFAARFEELDNLKSIRSEIEQFKQWQQESAVEKTRMEIASTKDKFYTENKVPAERRDLYESQVLMLAQSNPNLGIKDLPKLMKDVHDKMSKLFGSMERDVTQKYVQTKKADASKPSTQPKGQASKPKAESNPQASREKMIADIMADIRGQKDI